MTLTHGLIVSSEFLPFSGLVNGVVNDERLQRPPHHRTRRLRRGVRLSKGRHRQDVRDEVSGQEAHQDEAGRDAGAERTDDAVAGQHRGEYSLVELIKLLYAS